ncbi:MAG: endo alpha-1,4 polygalactosaminidase [Proteobacteria bacterium]|jgi:hypothetical protein|nr:endo alpha-1,4 polygalactosaminidase [Pseudomonadota bacterium]
MRRIRGFGLFLPVLALSLAPGCGGGDDDGDDGPPDWSAWDGGCEGEPAGDLAAGTTWQWQLTGAIDTGIGVAMYDIDLFNTEQSVIDGLHADGRFVVCYFSAGTWEEWRDDAGEFPDEVIGNAMEDWPDEKWLDVRDETVRELMRARLDVAVDKECDGVEPDNMDGYLEDNDSGFDFDGFDQLDYNAFIAEEAHARGLSVGLKNDVDQLVVLEPCYDWALNEECFAYDECDRYAPFVVAGKAVFHVEYVDDTADGQDLADEICGDPALEGFSTLVKDWDLTAWRIACE